MACIMIDEQDSALSKFESSRLLPVGRIVEAYQTIRIDHCTFQRMRRCMIRSAEVPLNLVEDILNASYNHTLRDNVNKLSP
jgi:hypothetical protein